MSFTYKHVVLVGIDGAGNFHKLANTPNIDKLFEEGAGSDFVLTSIPTISAECWGSMLIGVSPETHKLTNDIVSSREYADAEHPTLFKLVREARPDATLGAFCNWSPINNGIVERGLGVTLVTDEDPVLCGKICDYIKAEKPDFLFVQFDSIDGAGHAYGYGTEKYLEALSGADEWIGAIRRAIEDAGIADDTLYMVTADHGGNGHGHGGTTDGEKYVFFAAVGKTVVPGATPDMEVKDIPAIVTRALGVPDAANWEAKLPAGIFAD